MRSTPEVNAHSCAGSSSRLSGSKGPACTCRTVTPGASSATGGWSDAVARVNTSTSTPRRAISVAVWLT